MAAEANFSAEKVLDNAVARLARNDAGAPFRCAACIAIAQSALARPLYGALRQRLAPVRVSTACGECDSFVEGCLLLRMLSPNVIHSAARVEIHQTVIQSFGFGFGGCLRIHSVAAPGEYVQRALISSVR